MKALANAARIAVRRIRLSPARTAALGGWTSPGWNGAAFRAESAKPVMERIVMRGNNFCHSDNLMR
jgi:hypothetical protein